MDLTNYTLLRKYLTVGQMGKAGGQINFQEVQEAGDQKGISIDVGNGEAVRI